MRVAAWLILATLASGCVFPAAPQPEPSPDEPLAENPETLPPRTGPSPTSPPTGAPTPPSSEPPPPTPTPEAPPPEEPAQPTPTSPNYEIDTGWVPPEREGGQAAPRPLRFEPGEDSPDGTFVTAWQRSSDGLGFTASLGAVADATVEIDSLARLVSTGSGSTAFALWAQTIDDPYVTLARVGVWDAQGALVGELDLLAAAPTLEASIPADAIYELSWTLSLVEGAEEPIVARLRLDVAR